MMKLNDLGRLLRLILVGVVLFTAAFSQHLGVAGQEFDGNFNIPLPEDDSQTAAVIDPYTLFDEPPEISVKNLQADYRPDICRNQLIPFVWNFTANPPTRVVLRTAIKVLVGQTIPMAFALNATVLCPYAIISFQSYNPVATSVFLTDNPSLPYFNVSAKQMANVSITGKVIGYSAIKIVIQDPLTPENTTLYNDCGGALLTTCKFIAVSFFVPTTADKVYDLMTIIFTVVCQIDIGLRTKWTHVKNVVKGPLPAILGLACHFILMPVLAFAMARIVEVGSAELAMGFFFSGIVSGSGLSNLHTQVLQGDFQLSVIMTYASQLLSLGFTPLWLVIFGPLIVPAGSELAIPFDKIVITIIELLIPAICSFTFRHFFPKYGHFIQKFISYPLVALLFLYYCTYGLYTYQWMFQLFTPAVVLAGCLMPYFGFILSGLVALAFRQPWPIVVTIMMETSMQNIGIAMSIIRLSISDQILSTLSLVGPYSVLIFSQVPIVIVELFVFTKVRCIPRIKERMQGKNVHQRLDDDEDLVNNGEYNEPSESNLALTESQFDAESNFTNESEETKGFYSRQKDYFGKNLAS